MVDKEREQVELYNIRQDRLEQNNLADTNSEKCEELIAMWDKWKSTLPE